MNLKATVLVDNMEHNGMRGEWGLSIYIEYNDKKILLDTGASELFLENSDKIGISIKDVDYAVLSHAHYDHSNGMKAFFDINNKADFYLRKDVNENCYKKKRIFHKYIGLPRHILHDYRERIIYADNDYRLCDGVYLIPHKTENLYKIGEKEKMYRKINGAWCPDNFSHEQSLVFETDKGLIIFNSCSHGGAANIINEVAKTFNDKKVFGIIGGFHLYNKSEEEVRNLAKKIKETGIDYVCTGHCTKNDAYQILKEELGDTLHKLYVSMTMEF